MRCAMGSKKIKILVGGYSFKVNDMLWETMGADGFAPDAQEAVELSRKLFMKEDHHG